MTRTKRGTRNAAKVEKRDKNWRARLESMRRYRYIVVSGSLKLIVSEEICGRFGFVSTNGCLHINVPRLRSMMECQLHCL
ncbi:hypothetical protein OAB82_07355 [Amylibacter sp.]|nr:hypothetical protein [Amylibacter sp.]